MELDERKFKILEAVIRNYLQTGEPVGKGCGTACGERDKEQDEFSYRPGNE